MKAQVLKRPQPTTQPATTEASTTASTALTTAPDGYLESGSFSGGYGTTGINISAVRYGDNITYKRLVFDITGSNGGAAINQAPSYTASIGSDGRTLTLNVDGVGSVAAVDTKDLGGVSGFTSTISGTTAPNYNNF